MSQKVSFSHDKLCCRKTEFGVPLRSHLAISANHKSSSNCWAAATSVNARSIPTLAWTYATFARASKRPFVRKDLQSDHTPDGRGNLQDHSILATRIASMFLSAGRSATPCYWCLRVKVWLS